MAYLIAVFAHDTTNWLRGEPEPSWTGLWIVAAIMTAVGLATERAADPETIDIGVSPEDRKRAQSIVRRGEAVVEWPLVQPVVTLAEKTMRDDRRTVIVLPFLVAAMVFAGGAMVARHLDSGHLGLVVLGIGVVVAALSLPPRTLIRYRRARAAHQSALPLLQTARSGIRPTPREGR